MSLDDIYKTEDKNKLRYFNSLLPIIIFVLVGLCIGSIVYGKVAEYLEERAKINERFESISKLCGKVAQTEKLSFVSSKTIESTKNETTVVYTYRTDKQFAEIIPELKKYFNETEWRATNSRMSDFTNYNQNVSIQSNDNFSTNYQIYCSEKDISFGIYN